MQRWFFVEEGQQCAPTPRESEADTVNGSSATVLVTPECDWTFCLRVQEKLYANERLALTGNTSTLGNWKLENAILMTRDDEDNNVWQTTVTIPRNCDVKYRYLVIAYDVTNESRIVRRWETHLKARTVPEESSHCISQDIFGDYEGQRKVDRGWLTCETLVQLKFFNAPFTWKQRMKNRLMYVKVTPMHLRIPTNGCELTNGSYHHPTAGNLCASEDSLSNDNSDTRDNSADACTAFAFNEVVTLSSEDSEIHEQPQFGTACSPNDMLIFHLTLGDFESTSYLIDLYAYSSKAAADEPPYHVGYHYMLPNLLKRSEGYLEVPITCASRHRPLGMMKLSYLKVRPLPDYQQNMEVSYIRYWNPKWTGLDVGHRGSGTSFKTTDTIIRENTIASLKNAAEHGADMVEFDVQLSKDLIPVVYHDFMVYVLLKAKNTREEHDFLALPMRELTLQQLKNLKVYHTVEGRSRESRCFQNNDLQDYQPFPQLAEVLDAIDPHVGFNIEIKWSQKLQDGTNEEEFEQLVDSNLYVDCILDVVLRRAGTRRIVFSCFDPDICTMLRFKQNRYPVMFLTVGETLKYKKYLDPRCHTIQTATFHAVAMELLGVVAHTEDILKDPTKVSLTKNRGLILFCWGDDNNCKDTIKMLKNLGLHAIIYDKMDVLTSKEVKRSVFLLQAKESHKELLQLQALEMNKAWQQ